MKQLAEVRNIRVNRYMIIDEEPCKIMSITTSKPGKHGEAKARIEAIGIFDRQKRSVVHPVKHKIHVPMIDKRSAQILALMGDNVQLMDMETYETFQFFMLFFKRDLTLYIIFFKCSRYNKRKILSTLKIYLFITHRLSVVEEKC